MYSRNRIEFVSSVYLGEWVIIFITPCCLVFWTFLFIISVHVHADLKATLWVKFACEWKDKLEAAVRRKIVSVDSDALDVLYLTSGWQFLGWTNYNSTPVAYSGLRSDIGCDIGGNSTRNLCRNWHCDNYNFMRFWTHGQNRHNSILVPMWLWGLIHTVQ